MSNLSVDVHLHDGDDAPTVKQFNPGRFRIRANEAAYIYLGRDQLDQLGASIVAALHANDDPMPADVEQRVTTAIQQEAHRS